MEEIGLILIFEEIRKRGDEQFTCVLRAIEEGSGDCEAQETIEKSSWDEFKKEFPTLRDILIELFPTNSWEAGWRDGDRLIFIESIDGHEGLYEYDSTERVEVSWDELDEDSEEE